MATHDVRVSGGGAEPRQRRALIRSVARRLGTSSDAAESLLGRLPVTLPRELDHDSAAHLVAELKGAGFDAALEPATTPPRERCREHPHLNSDRSCSKCGARLCVECWIDADETDLCASCRPPKRSVYFKVRVTLLLMILAGVLAWAWFDRQRRVVRVEWERTVNVALVVIRDPSVTDASVYALKAGVKRLEVRLADEFQRHVGRRIWPFRFQVFGPVPLSKPPPKAPEQDFFGFAKFAYELWSFSREMDEAAGVPWLGMDTTLYVIAQSPKHEIVRLVEGLSQQGGRAGVATIDLDEGMVDFGLFVVTHELFHTLGAGDKYDWHGHSMIPEGLGEPDLVPLFPQRCAEIMARNVPITAERERPPLSLKELCVGPVTAQEIGWAARAPVSQRELDVK